MKDDQYLITGCNDKELHVWKITFLDNKNIELDTAVSALDLDEENEESMDMDMVCIIFIICIHYIYTWSL